MDSPEMRGLLEIARSALASAGSLLKADSLMFRAEMRAKGRALGTLAVAVAGLVLAGVVGLVFAALAAHLELIDRGMRPSLAALVVALAAMICAAGLTAYVLAALRAFSPIPTRTIGMMRKNFELLQPGRARVNDDI